MLSTPWSRIQPRLRSRLPASVWILILARAVNRLGALTLPFLTVTLVQTFHATIAQAGLVLAGFGLATIPSRLIGGRLADRIGGRRTIIAGLCGTAACQLAIAGSGSLTQVAVAAIALGLMFEVYEPPTQSMIADATPARLHPSAFSLLAAAMAVAGMAAGLLAAWVSMLDLRWLFVIDAATCLTCAAIVASALPAASPRSEGSGPAGVHHPATTAEDVSPLRDRRLLAMLALGTAFAVIYLQITISLPLTLIARGEPISRMGLLLTASAVTMVFGQPLLRVPALTRMDHFDAMALGYLTLGAGLLATGFATTTAAFMAATVIWSTGDLILLGRAYTIVAGLAPASGSGRYLAAYGTSWGLAAIVAPLVGTQLIERGGPSLIWGACAAACLTMSAAQPAMRQRIQRATTTEPAPDAGFQA
jgi:MFS family permease